MRLVFAIKTMHFAVGGAERVMATLCNGLAQRGHGVTLVSFDPRDVEPVFELTPHVDWVRLDIGEPWAPTRLGEIRRRISGLRGVLRQKRPEVATGFMHSSCIPLSIAALGTGIPLIFSEHNVPQYYRDRRLEYLLFLLSSSRATRVTVISEAFIPLYPRLLAPKMCAVSNPVALLSSEKVSVAGEVGGAKVLLSVGRLVEQKNHAALIRAFAAIAPNYPDWSLRIVGSGPLRNDLEGLAQSLNIGERVALVEAVKDIAAEYRGAHLYCIPSHYEGLGLAAAEALSLGLPVVGFADCLGANELIEDGVNGILVSGSDRVAGLGRALAELMGDSDLRERLGAEGSKILGRYSPDRFVSRWETLLSSLRSAAV